MSFPQAQTIQSLVCACQICNDHRRGVVGQLEPTTTPSQSESETTVGFPVQNSTEWVLSTELCEDEPGWALLPFYEDEDGTLYYPQAAWYYDMFHEVWNGRHGVLSPEDEEEYLGFWKADFNQWEQRSEEFPELDTMLSQLRITEPTSTSFNAPPSSPEEAPGWLVAAAASVRSSFDSVVKQARAAKKQTLASLRVVLFQRAAALGNNAMGLRRKAREAVVWRRYMESVSLAAAACEEEQEAWRWEEEDQPESAVEVWSGGFQHEEWRGMQENMGLGLVLD